MVFVKGGIIRKFSLNSRAVVFFLGAAGTAMLLARPVHAQVYGSGISSGFGGATSGMPLGSNTLENFRRYSTGADRFQSQQYGGANILSAGGIRSPLPSAMGGANNRPSLRLRNNSLVGGSGIGMSSWEGGGLSRASLNFSQLLNEKPARGILDARMAGSLGVGAFGMAPVGRMIAVEKNIEPLYPVGSGQSALAVRPEDLGRIDTWKSYGLAGNKFSGRSQDYLPPSRLSFGSKKLNGSLLRSPRAGLKQQSTFSRDKGLSSGQSAGERKTPAQQDSLSKSLSGTLQGIYGQQ